MDTNIILQDNTKDAAGFSIIRSKIYIVRGKRIMLDYDLANLYEVETRVLNQSVKRNIRRFPPDFMFQLTKEEWENMSSQIVMTSKTKRPKSAMPYAFTQSGIAMLSGLLNSDIAIDTNVLIMRVFVAVQEYAMNYAEIKQDLECFKTETNTKIGDIYEVLGELVSEKTEREKPRNPIGFKTKNNED